jgi:hypothetical protein
MNLCRVGTARPNLQDYMVIPSEPRGSKYWFATTIHLHNSGPTPCTRHNGAVTDLEFKPRVVNNKKLTYNTACVYI